MHCEPRIAVIPDRVRSAGPLITRVAEQAGIHLDEAQQLVANATAGVGADGRWAAFEAVIFSPRQNIKTEYLIARILAGLFVFGEDLIVYSAHQARTTAKTFGRLKRAIEHNPQLGARITRVSNRPGAETIELATGQALECVARSTSSGRGFSGSTIILDEAHELDGDQLAAILPMLSTRPNPQLVYALSLGNERSTHLGALRARALAHADPHVCWIEWSMAEGDRIDDREVWARCNPAYPARISMDYLEREWAALGSDPEQFARERLGKSRWPAAESEKFEVISRDAWQSCEDPGATAGGPVALGVALSPAGRDGVIAVCGPGPGGLPVTEIADRRPGENAAWIGPRLRDICGRHDVTAVAWEDSGLIRPLGLAAYLPGTVAALEMDPAGYAQACVSFSYAADEHTMRHRGDPVLSAAIGGARMKRYGRGGWAWHPDGLYAELPAAASLALHASGSDAGGLRPGDVTVAYIDDILGTRDYGPARRGDGAAWWHGTKLGH